MGAPIDEAVAATQCFHKARRLTTKSPKVQCFSSAAARNRNTRVWSQETAATTSAVTLDYTLYQGDEEDAAVSNVLFLHGLLGNRRNFNTIASALSEQLPNNTHLYALDLRHHGTTAAQQSSGDDDMSYVSMARDVLHFIQQHGLQQVTLVGHSMGGKVAQAAALLHPHAVDGLVVLDMAPVTYSRHDDVAWKAVCDVIDLLWETTAEQRPESKRALDQALRPGIPDPALRAFCLTNWNEREQRWKVNLEAIRRQLPILAAFDLNEASSALQFSGDVLLVHGGQSRFVRHAHLPTLQAFFPNHLITTVRGAGHWLHAEKPEDVISLLEKYLNRHAP